MGTLFLEILYTKVIELWHKCFINLFFLLISQYKILLGYGIFNVINSVVWHIGGVYYKEDYKRDFRGKWTYIV